MGICDLEVKILKGLEVGKEGVEEKVRDQVWFRCGSSVGAHVLCS